MHAPPFLKTRLLTLALLLTAAPVVAQTNPPPPAATSTFPSVTCTVLELAVV